MKAHIIIRLSEVYNPEIIYPSHITDILICHGCPDSTNNAVCGNLCLM